MNKLIIFDLDGTLINSVGGIANSVNRTRIELGFSAITDSGSNLIPFQPLKLMISIN